MASSPLTAASAPKPGRFYYVIAAVLLIAVMLTGFRRFYFAGRAFPDRELTPPIRTLIIVHGTAMALWMLVFLVQPILIQAGQRRLHIRLGTFAGFLAAAIVVLGLKLGIAAARVKPPGLLVDGLDDKQFLSVPVLNVLVFAGFVAAGILFRRSPAIHRAMMLLGTVAAIAAAVARIAPLSDLYADTIWQRIWGPFFMTVILALLLLILKSVLTRSFDRVMAVGCLVLAAAFAVNAQLATTAAWNAVATVLMR